MRHVLLFLCVLATMLVSAPTAAQQFQYDNAGRLTAALYKSGASIRYEYDAASNITRVQYISAPAAVPPDGVIDTPVDDVTIDAGQSVNFTGTGSDPDGATPLTFLWDFDGAAPDSNDEDPGDVTFASAGTYTVEFTATDATNLADPSPDTVVVTVNPVPPNGVIDTPTVNVSIETGQSVNFTGTASDQDGATPLTVLWDFGGGASNSTDEDPGNVSFATAGTYTVTFTVTDATGLVDPTPDSVVVTVTNPGGGPGGSTGGGDEGSSGGGSVFLLPLIMLLVLLARYVRSGLLVILFLAGTAQAQTWSTMDSGTEAELTDVWMHSATLAYAVGAGGTALQFDGDIWTAIDVGVTTKLTGVWGTGPNDVWIVGTDGAIHFDGTSWSPVDIDPEAIFLEDVWTAGAGEIVWMVGATGIWMNDGGTWTRRPIQTRFNVYLDPPFTVTSIRGTPDYMIATATGDFPLFVATSSAGAWGVFDWASATLGDQRSAWVEDSSFMVTVGETSQILDGGDPEGRNTADWMNANLGNAYGVWGADRQNFWAVGGNPLSFGYIVSRNVDSNSWEYDLQLQFKRFNSIHGIDENNVFAVGSSGVIYRLFVPEAEPTTANFPFAGTAEGNVNTHTGELYYETVDFSIGDEPLEFRRYYASQLWAQGTVGGSLAQNWTHNYEWRLDTDFEGVSGHVRITDFRGTEFVFDVGATSNTLISPTWANVTLTVDGDTYILANQEDGRMYGLDANGLKWIESRNGVRHTLIYNSGRLRSVINQENQIAFDYTAGGKMLRAYVPEGGEELEVAFTYSGIELTEATATSGFQESYTYDSGALLTSTAVGGATSATWTYDADDRVASTALTGGGTFSYEYAGNNLVVTEPGGSQRTYTHEAAGELVRFVDGEGAITDYGYDSAGRRVSITDPVGRLTEWAFDPVTGMLASVAQPGGFLTTYEYEAGSSELGVAFWNLSCRS